MPCDMAYTMPLTKRAQAAADISFVGHSDLVFAAALEQARIVYRLRFVSARLANFAFKAYRYPVSRSFAQILAVRHGMTGNEDGPPAGRSVRESEIFREPPGSGNYTSSIGAAVGIELFQGRGRAQRERSSKTIVEPERDVPVLAETDILVVGGGPAGTAAAVAAHGLAPMFCWLSATIIWAGFRPAVL